jgi:hypothetical protein
MGGLLTGESDSSLSYAALLFLEAHCPNGLFPFAQMLTGDGTLGTEYRLRGEWEKVSGVNLLRADLPASSRKRTKRHFRDFTYAVGGWFL